MAELLDMEAINSLPHPLYTGRGKDDTEWPITSICVQTGCCTMDVVGLSENFRFADLIWLIDADGIRHNPDSFYLDSEP